MEGAQVALTLHEGILQGPLFVEFIGVHLRVPVVAHCIPEVVERQVLDFHCITLCGETKLIRRRDVVKLAEVAGRHRFEAVAGEMAIELHEEANQGKIMRRNVRLQLAVVGVTV